MTRYVEKYLKMGIAIICFTTVSVIAWGKIQSHFAERADQAPPEDINSVALKYDPEVLKKLQMVCAKVAVDGDEFYLEGRIDMKAGQDTTANIHNAEYVLNKKGQSLYCKLGNTETINTTANYIYIDHSLKKILISEEKKITASGGLPDLSLLIKNMKEEGYQLLNQKSGPYEHITLLNEFHLSCKEYRISFKTETLEPSAIFLRISDPYFPEEKEKDKVLDIRINSSSQHSNKKFEQTKKIVEKRENSWVTAPGYENYELVVI